MGAGHKARKALAAARSNANDERAEIRAERNRMYAEQAARDAIAAAEHAQKQARARCSCVVCGEGLIDAEFAGRIITALQKLPAHVQTDPAILATLRAVVEGNKPIELAAAYSTDLGLKRPRKVYASAPTVDHGEPAVITPKDEPIVVPSKPKRKPTQAEIYAADGDENALDLG